MSDGLTISSGGAIAVDPEQMRDVSNRIASLIWQFDEARMAILDAWGRAMDITGLDSVLDTGALWTCSDRVAEIGERCRAAADGTRLMADAFEVVELRSQAEALSNADAARAAALLERAARIVAADERVAPTVENLITAWKDTRFTGLDDQFTLAPGTGGMPGVQLFGALATVGVMVSHGVLKKGETLRGAADPVRVTPVSSTTQAAPPASLADGFRAIPSDGDAQIRVDKLTFADGSVQFIAYLRGTQPFRADEPFDMGSNFRLYDQKASASSAAVHAALVQAGAEPGDRVDTWAHSQSVMIANDLAMNGEFDVGFAFNAGSPNQGWFSEEQTVVGIGHRDDVVQSLSGGGSPGGVGSPDSFRVERVADPAAGPQDLVLKAHQLDTYIETAEMADASGDPRVEKLQSYWDAMAQATTIESSTYVADRVGE